MARNNADTDNVTEIVSFYEFKQNEPEAAALELTKGIDGCIRSYHGLALNGDSGGIWVQEWLSLAHHVAFQNSPIYPSFTARVASFASTQQLDILHAQLRPYPATRAFTTPLTEMTIATLKSTSSGETIHDIMKEGSENLSSLSYGIVMEDSTCRQFLIVSGWETVEAHQAALSGLLFFKRLREIAELDIKLYKLTE